jgi:competence protein ComEC
MQIPTIIMRRVDYYDALFSAGVITVLWWPQAVLSLGFYLSYAAVLGLLLTHTASRHLINNMREYSISLAYLQSLFLASAAAFLATLPFVAIASRSFALFSIVANFFLLPLASICQIPAIILGLLGALLNYPTLIKAGSLGSNVLEIFTEAISTLLGGLFYLAPLSGVALFLLSLAANLIFHYGLTRRRALLLAAISCMIWPAFKLIPSPNLVVTVMPVGQGDATLFAFPSGEKLLIDAGGTMSSNFDPGARIVVPMLKKLCVKALDILVISHPDPDHIGGVFEVLDEIKVKEIWHSGFSQDHPLTNRLISVAKEKQITIKTIADIFGSHRFGESEVQILAPDPSGYYPELSANDNSVVVKIIHGGHSLLWPGDIELFGEKLLLSSNLDLSADILKAPHHGSKTSSSDAFINAVMPKAVIYTTAPRNRFGFPHTEIASRYQQRGIKEFNTAVDQEITIAINYQEISIAGAHKAFKEKT